MKTSNDLFRGLLKTVKDQGKKKRRRVGRSLVDVVRLIEEYSVEELCQAAEDYFKKVKDLNYLLSKPFASLHEAPSLLINFAHLIQGLHLVPGLTVLDFGAGSCWASRLLNQMGCSVISLDASYTALTIGKKLTSRQPIFGKQPEHTFLQFNGRTIDLPDDSVDRVFCYDAFHHVPNQLEVLREMCRVLRKGGIAGFSEPGPDHSESPQAQEEMRNHRVVENDIVIGDIFEQAKKVGFTDMRLLIYSLEPIVASFDKSDQLLEQGDLFLDYVHKTINYSQNHNTFFLCKGENELYDSRYRDGLLADIAVNVNSLLVKEGESFDIEVRVKNISNKVWLPSGGNTGSVNLGAHLHDVDNSLLQSGYLRVPLSEERSKKILPDEMVMVRCSMTALKTGKYIVEFDLVSENVCWFKESGSITECVAITVKH